MEFSELLGCYGWYTLSDRSSSSVWFYFNYKESFSIVLLELVYAQLRFIFVDVGTNGRVSERGIWNKCALKHHLEKNNINIPPRSPLQDTRTGFSLYNYRE